MTAAGMVVAVVIPAMAFSVPAHQAVALESPFSNGVWYVSQGGGSVLVNYHYPDIEQRYSLDLVRLSSAGRNCSGPESDIESHIAWGSTVVSPVSLRKCVKTSCGP